MKKVHAVLTIYDYLLNKKSFKTRDIEQLTGCSNRTCVRYIKDIRTYLEQSGQNVALVYSKQLKSFVLAEKE